jgi:hypothetical protein
VQRSHISDIQSAYIRGFSFYPLSEKSSSASLYEEENGCVKELNRKCGKNECDDRKSIDRRNIFCRKRGMDHRETSELLLLRVPEHSSAAKFCLIKGFKNPK